MTRDERLTLTKTRYQRALALAQTKSLPDPVRMTYAHEAMVMAIASRLLESPLSDAEVRTQARTIFGWK